MRLSTTTEYKIEQVLPSLAATPPRGAELWPYLGEILAQPHAAHALCAMHSLRLLTLLLPELKTIDSLVVRDFYHRFTVDEHSFLAIESLHRLRQSRSEWKKQYAEILDELGFQLPLASAIACGIGASGAHFFADFRMIPGRIGVA
jgi:[protein-PII] uridylyltransferase